MLLNPGHKNAIEFPGLFFKDLSCDFHAMLLKESKPSAGHIRVGVLHRGDHAPDSRADHRDHAGRRPAPVGAGFKVNIQRGAPRSCSCLLESIDFGMIPAISVVIALAYDLP